MSPLNKMLITRTMKVVAGLLFSLLILPSFSSASSPAGDVKEGKKLYEEEKYNEAAEKFIQAIEESPESDIVNYNLGAALYKKGQYKEAAEAFTKALVTEDRSLEAKAVYNLANSKYQLGSRSAGSAPDSAIGMYRESLDYYKRAIELDENEKDAKYNHELVEKKLKILLDQMKNQQQQNQQHEDNQEKDQKQESQQSQGEEREQEQGQQQKDAGEEDRPGGEDQKESPAGEEEEQDAPSENGKNDAAEMSPEEARMLLDAYGQEEARDDLKNKRSGSMRGVLKDW